MVIRFTCEYNGKNFNGFQRQARGNLRTVQAVLEEALSKYFSCQIKITGSGRTDAGVHARGQVCSFKISDDNIKAEIFNNLENPSAFCDKFNYKLTAAVNAFLPADVSVRNFEIANDNFNAQFSAKSKTYIYRCYVSPHRSPLRDETFLQLYKQPNIEKMKAAANLLIGEHNFKSFCSVRQVLCSPKADKVQLYELSFKPQVQRTLQTDKTDFIRTLYRFDIIQNNDEIAFIICGNGFLHNMVRIMCGTILDVGYSKTSVAQFSEILTAQNRKLAGQTSPAHALILDSVNY